MNKELLNKLFSFSTNKISDWENNWNKFEYNPISMPSESNILSTLEELSVRLKNNYPFFHPRYLGQMTTSPHPIAIASYVMAMLINPNNHARDGGPATAELEFEAVSKIAKMFGYKNHLGHLTSSGTIANLEALWISREIHPNKCIAFSEASHYTHQRMCQVLGVKYIVIKNNSFGRIDLNDLETKLKKNNIGTLVVNVGTTSIGAVDEIDKIFPLCNKYGVRIHADAAYGGFFILCANKNTPSVNPLPFKFLNKCDSIVVDPHKKGLQPYGCGCVIFKNPIVGKFYKHNSPYTYFTSDKLHLGEISLECSKSGASAAALWATLKLFPLESESGLGSFLNSTRESAIKYSILIKKKNIFLESYSPDLDIVTYFKNQKDKKISTISKSSKRIFKVAMSKKVAPLFLALLETKSADLKFKYPNLTVNLPKATVLRTVFMKPEHLDFVETFVSELENLT
ncbi:MAG: aminotransferase class V-fold PLP-dependent enzyme [Bacteroidota bacterium]